MWKQFGDKNTGELRAFLSDGSQDEWINENLIPVNDEIAEKLSTRELNSFVNNQWIYIETRTLEEIAEAERLAKLPSAEELQKNTIEIVVLDLLTEAGVL